MLRSHEIVRAAKRNPPMKLNIMAALGAVLLCGAVVAGAADFARAQNQFGEAKLEAFVTAAVTVEKLVQRWVPQINGAQSKEQSEKLQQQARAEVLAAIEETDGITLQEYQQIGEAIRNDPALSARLEKMFLAKRGN